MSTYSNTPPSQPHGPSLPLLRTPAFKPLAAIVTSEDLVGRDTHFYHGHTIPCTGLDCPAHADGIPYRWHAWLGAFRIADGLHFLFEMTAQAAESFVLYRKAHGSLRGCNFKSQRHNGKPNGRILIKTQPANLTNIILPRAPDLVAVLAILWNLPKDHVVSNLMDPERDISTVSVSTKPNPMYTPPPATETGDSPVRNFNEALRPDDDYKDRATDIPGMISRYDHTTGRRFITTGSVANNSPPKKETAK